MHLQKTENPKRFAFVVQGEGRGHLTQAIALKGMLERRGHEVCAVLVGKSPFRTIPDFFIEKIGLEVMRYESPNFIRDRKQKGVRIFRTMAYNFRKTSIYGESMHRIHLEMERTKPDVIINFYEVLFGIYSVIYQPKASIICLGNQYLNGHPDYPYPRRSFWNKFLYKSNTWITGLRCQRYLALSFSPYTPFNDPFLAVVPPLLREEVFTLKPSAGDHFLVYILNEGYHQELMRWHRKNPQYRIHAFWDKKGVEDPHVVDENLIFHQISDTRFLELMASCRALATTAGFQSVCEAALLEKPVLVVPTRNHFEQRCNAIDVRRIGLGVSSSKFNLDQLIEFEARYRPLPHIREWILAAERSVIDELEKSVENESFSRFLTKMAAWVFRHKVEPEAKENRKERQD